LQRVKTLFSPYSHAIMRSIKQLLSRFRRQSSPRLHSSPHHTRRRTPSTFTHITTTICLRRHYRSNEILLRSAAEDSNRTDTHLTFGEMLSFTQFMHYDKMSGPTALNPEQLLIQSGEFTRSEARHRVAKLIMCLRNLPYGVADTESVQSVIADYLSTYQEIKSVSRVTNLDDVHKYVELTKYWLLKHLLVIPKISYGLLQKATQPNTTFSVETCPYLNDFIDEFASQRLALRVLSGHLVTMYEQAMFGKITSDENAMTQTATTIDSNLSGLFEQNCDVTRYVRNAIADSKTDCVRMFDRAPNVVVYDKRKTHANSPPFTYIPEHLHHMVFELLKNSMRAVIECQQENGDQSSQDEQNSIDVVIVNNASDGSIAIKLSDIGGGIARDKINKMWLYSYTTAYDLNNLSHDEKLVKQRELLGQIIESAEHEWQYSSKDVCDLNAFEKHDKPNIDRSVLGALKFAPMFGLGYGLPVVKIYAQYFGGDCKIQSIDGYGTDAYLYLNNLYGSNVRVI